MIPLLPTSFNKKPTMNTTRGLTYTPSNALSGNILQETLRKNPTATHLSLYGCISITPPEFMRALFPRTLKSIDVSFTNITNKGLQQIFACCPQLETVTMISCHAISIPAFSVAIPKTLHHVDCTHTRINPDELRSIITSIHQKQEKQFVNDFFLKHMPLTELKI